MKKIATSVMAYGISALLLIAIVSVLALFGGFIMKFFGFQYDSLPSIILFFVFTGLLGFPIEVIAMITPRALLSHHKLSLTAAKVLFIILDSASTVLVMTMVDFAMDSVKASGLAILVIAVIIALSSMSDVKPKIDDTV